MTARSEPWFNIYMTTTRNLPRDFDPANYSIDDLARATEIAHERACAAMPGSRSRTYWARKAQQISTNAHERGFCFRRTADGTYTYHNWAAGERVPQAVAS